MGYYKIFDKKSQPFNVSKTAHTLSTQYNLACWWHEHNNLLQFWLAVLCHNQKTTYLDLADKRTCDSITPAKIPPFLVDIAKCGSIRVSATPFLTKIIQKNPSANHFCDNKYCHLGRLHSHLAPTTLFLIAPFPNLSHHQTRCTPSVFRHRSMSVRIDVQSGAVILQWYFS